jgi:hypothetical protein
MKRLITTASYRGSESDSASAEGQRTYAHNKLGNYRRAAVASRIENQYVTRVSPSRSPKPSIQP